MGRFERSRSGPRRLAACLIALAIASVVFVAGPLTPRGHGPAALAADDDPFFIVMQSFALDQHRVLKVSEGGLVTHEDIVDDVLGLNDNGVNDLSGGSYAWLPSVPSWLLDTVFPCSNPDVACPRAGSDDAAFADGAYLFYQRMAGPTASIDAAKRGEWGPILALSQYPTAPLAAGSSFGGGSHGIITRNDLGVKDVLYFAYVDGTFQMFATNSRSRSKDDDFLTIVPRAKEVQTEPVGWDVYASSSDGTEAGTGRDTIRGLDGAPLLAFDPPPTIEFAEGPATSGAPPASASLGGPASSGSAASSAAPSPSVVPAEPATGSGIVAWPIIAVLVGIVVVLIGVWLVVGRGRRSKPADSEPPTPGPEPTPTPEPPTPEPPTPEPPPIPPVPPPQPRDCDDGDEEWRDERPPQSFVVPPADAKVRISNDRTTAALEAWLYGFGFPRGAPFAAFVELDDEERDRLLDALPGAASEIHWTIEFQLDDYRLACQRRWVCDGGAWVPTPEMRLLESGPDPFPARFAVDGPARTIDDVRRIWKDARAVLVAAEAAVSSMEAYRAGCA